MICPNCQAANESYALKCKSCGTPLRDSYVNKETPVKREVAVETKYNRKNCIWQFIQLVVTFMFLFIVFIKIAPTVKAILAEYGKATPLITILTIGVSNLFRTYFYLLLIFAIFPLFTVAALFAFIVESYRATIKTFMLIKFTLIIIIVIAVLSMIIPLITMR